MVLACLALTAPFLHSGKRSLGSIVFSFFVPSLFLTPSQILCYLIQSNALLPSQIPNSGESEHVLWRSQTLLRDSKKPVQDGAEMKRRIDGRGFLKDLAKGMSEEALRTKYALSAEQLRTACNQFVKIRQRRLQAILDDIGVGMTDTELMEKYQLRPAGLCRVMEDLLASRGVGSQDLQISPLRANGGTKRTESRNASRNFPVVLVSACEAGQGDTAYQLNDITHEGVGISGITAHIGEIKTIVVLGDEFGLVDPFEFQAECRWTGTQEPHGDPCAGFRITKISDQDYGFLEEFIGHYTFATETY